MVESIESTVYHKRTTAGRSSESNLKFVKLSGKSRESEIDDAFI